MFLWIRTLFCIEYEIENIEGGEKSGRKVHISSYFFSRASYMFPVCVHEEIRNQSLFSEGTVKCGRKVFCLLSFCVESSDEIDGNVSKRGKVFLSANAEKLKSLFEFYGFLVFPKLHRYT